MTVSTRRLRRLVLARSFAAVAILLAACGTSIAVVWALQHPAASYGRPETQGAAGIVVLGGGLQSYLVARREGKVPVGPGERVSAAVELAARMPRAKLLFTGKGESDPTASLESRGIAADRILLEGRSSNTAENATYSAKLVGADRRRTWILVTSAYHMPRVLACFRAAGFEAVPYAVDFVHPWDVEFWPKAWLELVSTAAYRLSAALGPAAPGVLSRRCVDEG